MKKLLASILGAALAVACSLSHAESFPGKTVTIYVPFAPGGPSDSIVRILAGELAKKWGNNVVVENKAGANTIIATQQVVRAEADGNTMMLGTLAWATNPYLMSKLPYETNSLNAVAFLGEQPQILYMRKDMPVTTVPELVAFAKKKNAPLMFGTPGNGTSPHLTGIDFASRTGIDATHVPYKGTAPANTDLISGQIDVMFVGDSNRVFVDGGRMNALFVANGQRLVTWKTLQTAKEAGLSNFESAAWFNLLVPSATPDSVKTRINIDVNEVLGMESVASKFEKVGVFVKKMSATQSEAFMDSERAKYGALITKNNIKLD